MALHARATPDEAVAHVLLIADVVDVPLQFVHAHLGLPTGGGGARVDCAQVEDVIACVCTFEHPVTGRLLMINNRELMSCC